MMNETKEANDTRHVFEHLGPATDSNRYQCPTCNRITVTCSRSYLPNKAIEAIGYCDPCDRFGVLIIANDRALPAFVPQPEPNDHNHVSDAAAYACGCYE